LNQSYALRRAKYFCNTIGTLLPRANAAACPQLAKADFASSSQHVREGQRIAELEAEIDELQRQALALGAEPSADAEGDECGRDAEIS
jgi:hypothetical protein